MVLEGIFWRLRSTVGASHGLSPLGETNRWLSPRTQRPCPPQVSNPHQGGESRARHIASQRDSCPAVPGLDKLWPLFHSLELRDADEKVRSWCGSFRTGYRMFGGQRDSRAAAGTISCPLPASPEMLLEVLLRLPHACRIAHGTEQIFTR